MEPHGSARYRVTFLSAEGLKDVVTVWDESPDSAVRSARDWIEQSQEYPLTSSSYEVQFLGPDPDSFDLGVVPDYEGVNHHRFSPAGEPMSTLFRAEPDHILRLTRRLRSDSSPAWEAVRAVLRAHHLDPSHVMITSLSIDGSEPPEDMTLVTEPDQVYALYTVSHPKLGEDGLPRMTGTGALEMVPGPGIFRFPQMDRWDTHVDRAFALLREDAKA